MSDKDEDISGKLNDEQDVEGLCEMALNCDLTGLLDDDDITDTYLRDDSVNIADNRHHSFELTMEEYEDTYTADNDITNECGSSPLANLHKYTQHTEIAQLTSGKCAETLNELFNTSPSTVNNVFPTCQHSSGTAFMESVNIACDQSGGNEASTNVSENDIAWGYLCPPLEPSSHLESLESLPPLPPQSLENCLGVCIAKLPPPGPPYLLDATGDDDAESPFSDMFIFDIPSLFLTTCTNHDDGHHQFSLDTRTSDIDMSFPFAYHDLSEPQDQVLHNHSDHQHVEDYQEQQVSAQHSEQIPTLSQVLPEHSGQESFDDNEDLSVFSNPQPDCEQGDNIHLKQAFDAFERQNIPEELVGRPIASDNRSRPNTLRKTTEFISDQYSMQYQINWNQLQMESSKAGYSNKQQRVPKKTIANNANPKTESNKWSMLDLLRRKLLQISQKQAEKQMSLQLKNGRVHCQQQHVQQFQAQKFPFQQLRPQVQTLQLHAQQLAQMQHHPAMHPHSQLPQSQLDGNDRFHTQQFQQSCANSTNSNWQDERDHDACPINSGRYVPGKYDSNQLAVFKGLMLKICGHTNNNELTRVVLWSIVTYHRAVREASVVAMVYNSHQLGGKSTLYDIDQRTYESLMGNSRSNGDLMAETPIPESHSEASEMNITTTPSRLIGSLCKAIHIRGNQVVTTDYSLPRGNHELSSCPPPESERARRQDEPETDDSDLHSEVIPERTIDRTTKRWILKEIVKKRQVVIERSISEQPAKAKNPPVNSSMRSFSAPLYTQNVKSVTTQPYKQFDNIISHFGWISPLFREKRKDEVCYHCKARTATKWRRTSSGQRACNACDLYFRKSGIQRPFRLIHRILKRRTRHKNRKQSHQSETRSTLPQESMKSNENYTVSASDETPMKRIKTSECSATEYSQSTSSQLTVAHSSSFTPGSQILEENVNYFNLEHSKHGAVGINRQNIEMPPSNQARHTSPNSEVVIDDCMSDSETVETTTKFRNCEAKRKEMSASNSSEKVTFESKR